MLTKRVCTDDFQKEILDNEAIDQCIVQIFGDFCPGCQAAAVILAALTHKMERHGYRQDLPLFQIKEQNEVPWLGQIGYTPAFFHLRKNKQGQITELRTLDKWQHSEKFMPQLAECSCLPGLQERVVYKWREQMGKHFNKATLQDGFDFDFDMARPEQQ